MLFALWEPLVTEILCNSVDSSWGLGNDKATNARMERAQPSFATDGGLVFGSDAVPVAEGVNDDVELVNDAYSDDTSEDMDGEDVTAEVDELVMSDEDESLLMDLDYDSSDRLSMFEDDELDTVTGTWPSSP